MFLRCWSDRPQRGGNPRRRYGLTGILCVEDRKAEIAAYSEAAKKASALLEQLGMTEDEVVAEFDAMRKARRKEPREAASAS